VKETKKETKEGRMSGGGRLKVNDGDWICSAEGCENLNFARRDKCNKCGEAKQLNMLVKNNTGTEIGERFAEKSKGLFSANDWQCAKCGNINWARRSTCNVCNAPKVGPEELRNGYGGGFKENDGVTYKEKEDSDGEYDEFGRKKKKFRGKVPVVETVIETPVNPSPRVANDDDDDEDDDDDDVDLSKYALSSDDEDEAGSGNAVLGGDGNGVQTATNNTPTAAVSRGRSKSSRSSSSSSSSGSSTSSRSRSRSPRRRSRSRSRSPRRRRSQSPKRRTRSRSPAARRSRSPHRR